MGQSNSTLAGDASSPERAPGGHGDLKSLESSRYTGRVLLSNAELNEFPLAALTAAGITGDRSG